MSARALVVDDDSTVRYTLRGMLELAGVTVEEAADGVSALESLETSAFDLVITDLRMPRMDGFELLGKLRERGSAAPRVIVVTAHGSERHAVEAIKRGAYVKNVWLKGDDLAAFVEHEGEPEEDARGPSVRPHRSFREGTVVDGPTFPVSAGLRSNVSSAIATPVHCRLVDDP